MAASGPNQVGVAWVTLALSALLGGCATTPSSPQGSNPRGHCMRLIGLDAYGRSVIVEAGAPQFVKGAEPGPLRYHLQQHGPEPETEVLTEAECRLHQICDAQGPKLERYGLFPAEHFQIATTKAPGEVKVDVPGVGEGVLTFAPREDRFGEPAWTLAMVREDPWVLYRAAPTLNPTEVRWYRAGSYLWLQLETDSPGVACVALSVDLAQAGASVLDDDAVKALRKGRYDEARDLLERALRVSGDDETVAYNLACTWALIGDDEQALQWLAEAFRLDPEGKLKKLATQDEDLQRLWTNDAFLALIAQP